MARYFFQVDGDPSPDDEGTDIACLNDAKRQAVKFAGRAISDNAGEFWDQGEWKLTVADTKGLTLFSLTLVGTEAKASMAAE